MIKLIAIAASTVLAVITVDAQITITQADLPQAGYTYLTYTDTTPSVTLGSPSATAQSWNYSSLGQDYPSVPTYGLTSWTPYASSFPTSNIYTYGPAALYSSLAGGAPVGSQGMNKGYMFWRTEVTGFYTVGFRADSGAYANVNVQVTPNELLIGTPTTYNSTFNNTSAWTFPMAINSADYDTFYTSRTVKTLTTDAWGDITTPAGYFPSVIRIHEYLVKVDSVYIKQNNITIYSMELLRDTANNYLFMANGVNYPISIVHANAANTITSVEYYSGTIASVGENTSNGTSIAYPSPCREECKISLPAGFSNGSRMQFTLIDVTGKVVRREDAEGNEFITFLRGDLETGMYIYTITNKNGEVVSGKLNITQ